MRGDTIIMKNYTLYWAKLVKAFEARIRKDRNFIKIIR